MKKVIDENKDNKIAIKYYYKNKNGKMVRKETIEKKEKLFKKLYIDTIKHEQDVRRWIESGTRKKGDIRRSLERLDSKYQELNKLKNEFDISETRESEILGNYSNEDKKINLIELDYRINKLHNLAGVTRKKANMQQIKSIYGDEIELVTDIPGNYEMIRVKNRRKSRNKFSRSRKLVRRLAAFVMAMSMAIFAGGKTGNIKVNTNQKDINAYTDNVNREKDRKNFRESLYIEATENLEKDNTSYIETQNIMPSQKQENKEIPTSAGVEVTQNKTTKNEKTKSKQIINRNSRNDYAKEKESEKEYDEETNEYLAKANTRYTESSNESGAVGYFSKDTRVKVYNRALVKTDENGNKQILEVTKVGQTWKEYAKEKQIDYDEFKEYINNKNIKKFVSLDSADGTEAYGWVLEDTLEKIGELER